MRTFSISDIEVVDDKVPTEKLLTGEYIKGLGSESTVAPNVEVEKNEYVKFPDGETQKVIGQSHERGGVNMNIPDDTAVLSDHLTLSKNQVKQLEKDYGLNLTTKHTYAQAMDKFVSRIGLRKLNSEQEEVFSALKDEMNKQGVDSKTAKINLQYLSSKIHQLEEQKKPLEEQKKAFFNVAFKFQEQSKPASERADNLENGGFADRTISLTAKKYGLTPEQANQLLQRGGRKLPTFDGGGLFVDQGSGLPTGADLTDKQKESLLKYYEKFVPETAKAIKDGKVAWKNIVLNKGLVDDLDEKGYDKIITGYQSKDKPGVGLKNAPTYGGMTQRRVDNFVLKPYYEAKNPGKKFEDISSKEIGELQRQYSADLQSSPFGSAYYSGVKGDKQVDDTYYGNRTSSYIRGMAEIPGAKAGRIDVDRLIAMGREDADKELQDYGIKYDDLEKYKSAAYKYIDIVPEDPEKAPPVEDPNTSPKETPEKVKVVDGKPVVDKVIPPAPGAEYPRLFYTPDQSSLPPTAMDAHLKGDIRLQRIDPVRIGIDTQLQEVANQRRFVANQLEGMPDSQRAAVIANMIASGNKSINAAATQANTVNAQNQSQAELFNIQQAGNEQLYGLNNSLNFEQRQLTAKAKTEEELRRYYDQNNKVNLSNFQNNQKLNLLDSLFPDYNLDPFGMTVSQDPNSRFTIDESRAELAKMGNLLTNTSTT